jgi:hypothetical protein
MCPFFEGYLDGSCPNAMLLLVFVPVKLVQQAVQHGYEHETCCEDEDQAGVQRIEAGEDLPAFRSRRVHRPQKLYVTIGSNSNVGERGMEAERDRAAIWEVDIRTGAHRIFASGLRNPNGLAREPLSGVLWAVVNERDELGSDLVPDYMTSVRNGGFYGWPYSYYGQKAAVSLRTYP